MDRRRVGPVCGESGTATVLRRLHRYANQQCLENCPTDLVLPENEIVGDALVALKHDELKEMGIASVGHRITILKAVYETKLRQDIPIDPDNYIPQCAYPLTFALLLLTLSLSGRTKSTIRRGYKGRHSQIGQVDLEIERRSNSAPGGPADENGRRLSQAETGIAACVQDGQRVFRASTSLSLPSSDYTKCRYLSAQRNITANSNNKRESRTGKDFLQKVVLGRKFESKEQFPNALTKHYSRRTDTNRFVLP